MLLLSPEKLLVVLIVALFVLGPDKLPKVAEQVGGLWRTVREWRTRARARGPVGVPRPAAPAHDRRGRSLAVGDLDRLAAGDTPVSGTQATGARDTATRHGADPVVDADPSGPADPAMN